MYVSSRGSSKKDSSQCALRYSDGLFEKRLEIRARLNSKMLLQKTIYLIGFIGHTQAEFSVRT